MLPKASWKLSRQSRRKELYEPLQTERGLLSCCAIPIVAAPAPVPAGLANLAPARPCMAAGLLPHRRSLQTATMQKTFNAKTQRRKGATKNNSIKKPENHEIFSMILGFLVS